MSWRLGSLAVVVAVTAWWMTERFRRYALDRQLLDIPNERSSHQRATPRGGGMAIVVTTLAALPVLGAIGALPWPQAAGLALGGALVALVGFVDDHGHVPPPLRLAAHAAAAVLILIALGGLPAVPMFGVSIDLGWLGDVLAALYIVWLLNLTNFMDGIDGIAGVEAVTVAIGGGLLYEVAAPGTGLWSTPVILAAAAAGFLVWNWPPARVFMGDAGSGFVGWMLAALSLQAAGVSPALLWSWIILLGVFVIDATVTLLRRLARRERLYEAHRSHAYQHAARAWAHRPVTLTVAAINVLWLLPMAWLVARGGLDGLAATLIAYVPLVALALWFKAGVPSAL
jgi:Fuc2NAc and GlcNAc transferase